MPFVNVKLVDGVFTEDEKHRMAAALTDVMVQFEGSEAFREVRLGPHRRTAHRRLAHRRASLPGTGQPNGRPRPFQKSLRVHRWPSGDPDGTGRKSTRSGPVTGLKVR
ncbi:tautomerase family protein [Arthrobacter sp. FW306-05-C]|nr:tautomerase family protein [Arthrobacter sp. FW306-05-C]